MTENIRWTNVFLYEISRCLVHKMVLSKVMAMEKRWHEHVVRRSTLMIFKMMEVDQRSMEARARRQTIT